MSLYLVLPLLIGVAVGQSTVIPALAIAGVKPDLMLTVVISWSLLRGAQEGMIWGFLGGLCLDLFSGIPVGVSAIALMSVSLLSGLGEMNLFKGHLLLPLILVPLDTLSYYGLLLGILWLIGEPIALGPTFLRVVLPAMVINLVTTLFVYAFLRGLHRRIGHRQIDW